MDDLQCFVWGFHIKHVADIQKLAEVGVHCYALGALYGALKHLV
jgi:hypothetical protein